MAEGRGQPDVARDLFARAWAARDLRGIAREPVVKALELTPVSIEPDRKQSYTQFRRAGECR